MLQDLCDAEVWSNAEPPSRQDILTHLGDTQGLLSLLTDRIDAALIDSAPHLRVISNCAVGVDNIDVDAATLRGIPVGNTPDVLTDATADMAFALMLSAGRRILEGVNYVRSGSWKTWDMQLLLGADLVGATLGVIGFGRIGRAVTRRAAGFNLRVIFHDPTAQPDLGATPVTLTALLEEADFVSLHVPLTAQTRHLINAQTLRLMKPSAVLVNTSRGSIVDMRALYAALTEHRIFAAGLDVTEPEPIETDNPLLGLDNCIIVPHLGSASQRTREQMAILAVQNLIAGLNGEPLPHCVNPEVYP
jgi:glyoxylate reductase